MFVVGLSNGQNRWSINMGDATAEAGANAGSDFSIARFNDAGASLGAVLTIARNSGSWFTASTISTTGQIISGGLNSSMGLTVSAGGAVIKDSIELGGTGTTAYIDWHTNTGNADFAIRTSVSSANGNDIFLIQSATGLAHLVLEGSSSGLHMQNVSFGTSTGGPNTIGLAWFGTGDYSGHVGIRVDLYQAGAIKFKHEVAAAGMLKNVAPMTLGLDALLMLNPIIHEYDHDVEPYLPGGVHLGFNLAEMELAVPRAVDSTHERIDSSVLIPVLVNAIKTLNERLEAIGA
jgi:hypothetical protein